MRGLPLFSSMCFLLGCSGGSGLEGDGGGDAPDFLPDGSDAADVVPDDAPADGADGTDLADPCRPQDAAAQGPCNMVLDGVKWDGAHCIGLGSGCACAGEDCGSLYETVEECVAARRMCYDASCDPQPVAEDTCVDCDGFGFLGVFWDGRECFELIACMCRGEGCDAPFASIVECEAVHASCDSALCRETGGQWFPAMAGFCGFSCGVRSPFDCEADSCRCGPGRTFVPGEGCREDPGCTPGDACRATRGEWHPASECFCGFRCGMPNDCEACVDSCDCGPHRNFDPTGGCVPDEACGDVAAERICEATGGRWHEGELSCGDYVCGVPNTWDACIAPGCECGFSSNFDHEEGCVYDDGCYMRAGGESCAGWAGSSTCRAGLVCCAHCAISGCLHCDPPCCPDGSGCMEDGCFPPPP